MNDVQEVLQQCKETNQEAEMKGRTYVLKALLDDKVLYAAMCKSPRYMMLLNDPPLKRYLLAETATEIRSIDAQLKTDIEKFRVDMEGVMEMADALKRHAELEGDYLRLKKQYNRLIDTLTNAQLRELLQARDE